MKKIFKVSAILAATISSFILIPRSGASAEANRVLVIVKADSPLASFNLKGIRAIYLGEKLYVGSDKIEPLVNGDETLAGVFYKKVLEKSKAQFKKIWSSKGFVDGLAAPATLPSGEDVLRNVLKSDNAIGFISEKDLTPTVKKSVLVIYAADASEK